MAILSTLFSSSPDIGTAGRIVKGIGTGMSIEAIARSGRAAADVAQFNIDLEKANLSGRLNILGGRLRDATAAQRVAASRSGFAIGSKSVLQVIGGTLRDFERRVLEERNISKQRQDAIAFQGELEQHRARSQAGALFIKSALGPVTSLIRTTLLGDS